MDFLPKQYGSDELFEQLEGSYFKSFYSRKPTKRLIKLWKQIKAGEKISESGR